MTDWMERERAEGRGIADFLASPDGELPAVPTITTTNSSPLTTAFNFFLLPFSLELSEPSSIF